MTDANVIIFIENVCSIPEFNVCVQRCIGHIQSLRHANKADLNLNMRVYSVVICVHRHTHTHTHTQTHTHTHTHIHTHTHTHKHTYTHTHTHTRTCKQQNNKHICIWVSRSVGVCLFVCLFENVDICKRLLMHMHYIYMHAS